MSDNVNPYESPAPPESTDHAAESFAAVVCFWIGVVLTGLGFVVMLFARGLPEGGLFLAAPVFFAISAATGPQYRIRSILGFLLCAVMLFMLLLHTRRVKQMKEQVEMERAIVEYERILAEDEAKMEKELSSP